MSDALTREETLDIIRRFPELAARHWRISNDGRGTPRAVATLPDGGTGIVNVRFTRWPNSAHYEHWLTMRGGDYRAMPVRPNGFTFWYLQIGRGPDGIPWWAALWPEEALRETPNRELERDNGRWFAFRPVDFPDGVPSIAVLRSFDVPLDIPEPEPMPETETGRAVVAARPEMRAVVLQIEREAEKREPEQVPLPF